MKKFGFFAALLLICSLCKAQTPTVTDANASLHSTSNQGIVACTYTIIVSDTTDISNIEINLGTSSGNSDLFTQDIAFDNAGSLPQDWTYSRSAYTITINAGTYAESNIYFGHVRLKNNGTWGSPFQFIAN